MDEVIKEMQSASKFTVLDYLKCMDWHTLLHMNDKDKVLAIAARMELIKAYTQENKYLSLTIRLSRMERLLKEIKALL